MLLAASALASSLMNHPYTTPEKTAAAAAAAAAAMAELDHSLRIIYTSLCRTWLRLRALFAGHNVAYQLQYRPIGLLQYEILGVADLENLEREHKLARAARNASRRALRLLMEPQRRAKQKSKATTGGKVGKDTRDAGKEADEVDVASDDDDKDGSEEDSAESGEASSLDPAMNSASDADILLQPDSDDDGDEGGLPSIEANGKVYSAVPPHEYLGRVSKIHVGTPKETFSIYCSRHGCNFMRGIVRRPSDAAIRQWFRDGEALDRVKSAENIGKHRAKWPDV